MLSDTFMIGDKQWELIEPYCLGKKSDQGRSGSDAHLFAEAVFGLLGQVLYGAIFRLNLASGTQFSSGSDIGLSEFFSYYVHRVIHRQRLQIYDD